MSGEGKSEVRRARDVATGKAPVEGMAGAVVRGAFVDHRRWGGIGLGDLMRSESTMRLFLCGLPGVDQVGVEARAGALATRSIKTTSKLWAIETAIRMVELTTLRGADTPGTIRTFCGRARRPDPGDPEVPSVSAVCVYSDRVGIAVGELAGSGVKVASVATAFPSGRASLANKLTEVRDVVAAGADEVAMVIDRGAFLSGRYGFVYEEVQVIKEACGMARLKVILETGELATYDNVYRACWLVMIGGADFVETSTGTISPATTLPIALVMLQAVRDFAELSGALVGVKVAGGICTTLQAIQYLVVVNETVGEAWLDPARFRFGASDLLTDLLMQRSKQLTGAYARREDFDIE